MSERMADALFRLKAKETEALRAELAKVSEERDALAAALNKRDEEWCYVLESIRKEMKSGRDFNGNPFLAAASRMTMKPLPDVHAILAARDKRQQALGAAKWIEWYRDHQALEYEREYLDGHAEEKRKEAGE